MFKKKLIVVVMSIIMISVGSFLYVYLGRIDLLGGYCDNKNKFGLGSYYYYCGGYLVYLYNNGGCFYIGGGSSFGIIILVNNEEK